MFTYATDLVSGGWNSVDNVIWPAEVPAIGSGFFPNPQRDRIESNITQPAGGTGQTYRQTSTDAPSVFETMAMSIQGWLGSPYQQQYSIPAKIQESQQLAGIVENKKANGIIEGGLDWALETSRSVKTLWDEIKTIFDKPREVITEKPRAGYPEGENIVHYNDTSSRSAEVVERIAKTSGQVIDQLKGLFNLGYPQTQPQPVTGVQGELISPALPIGLILIVLFLFLVLK